MDRVERWGLFELTLDGPREGNPFVDVALPVEGNGRRTLAALAVAMAVKGLCDRQ